MPATVPPPSLMYGQFMRGLSGGLFILALAGVFWFNSAAWAADCALAGVPIGSNGNLPLHYLLWEPWVALAGAAVIGYFAFGVRRKARGFRYSQLRNASPAHRALTRRIVRTFLLTAAGEGALCGIVGYLVSHFHRVDLLWPGIGLAVSLHFIPLATIFRVPPYRVLGIIGSVVSTAVLLVPGETSRLIVLGSLMGASLWIAAAYIVFSAERLALAWETVNSRTIG